VARQVVDVDERRALLVEELREVRLQPAVAQCVAREGVALREVVHYQPHARSAVDDLCHLAAPPARIGHPGEHAYLAVARLAQGQAAGVHLGACGVPGRPAVDEVHHADGEPRGQLPSRGTQAVHHPLAARRAAGPRA
jgi:hypothetical protein